MIYLLSAFMLFESLYCIGLKTDPIHRENFKWQAEWLINNANQLDGAIAIEPEFSYYTVHKNKKNEIQWETIYNFKILPTISELELYHVKGLNRIFLCQGYSMIERVNQENLDYAVMKMATLGFGYEKMVKTGEKDMTVIYVFKKK